MPRRRPKLAPETPLSFFEMGMKLLNRTTLRWNTSSERIFRENFGVSPIVLVKCWDLLMPEVIEFDQYVKPIHLLWTCLFLKTYGKEGSLASMVGTNEKTFRKWTWFLIYAIADLEPYVIVWENRKKDDCGEDCLVSVDCTDLVIQSPQNCSGKIWYSHKHNGPGLRYEIALSLKNGHLVWVHGPYPCGKWPDINIFRNCLCKFLDRCERVEADDGYIGDEPLICKTPGGFSSRCEDKDEERRRIRARHETVNQRFKCFGIISQTYRHDLDNHGFVFSAVAVFVQLLLENGNPLFQL